MKGILLWNEIINKKVKKHIEEYSGNIFIVSSENFFKEIRDKYPEEKVIYIDIFKNKKTKFFNKESKKIINKLSHFINRDFLYNGFINLIYSNYIKILYNSIYEIEKVTELFNVNDLVLYGGNKKVDYLTLSLSEGERPFRFLYKRSWLLNYYINNVFIDKYNIIWENQDNKLKLKLYRLLRSKTIVLGKTFFLIVKRLKEYLKNPFKNKSKVEISKMKNDKKKYVLLSVRTTIQLESLLPIYNEINNQNNFVPIFILYENYTEKELLHNIKKHNKNYINLYDLLTCKDLVDTLKITLLSSLTRRNHKFMLDNNIEVNLKGFINELSIYWLDLILKNNLLLKLEKAMNSEIKYFINVETKNHNAAIDYYWCKNKAIPIYGIQHTSISDYFLPKISWVDTMFLMSDETNKKLKKLRPEDNYQYLGPVAYDNYYNKSKSGNELHKIAIFTQPDNFINDYIDIIKKIVDIKMGSSLNYKIIVKLHPREERLKLYRRWFSSDVIIIKNEVNSLDLLKEVDLCISINSSVIIQSIIMGTPVLSVNPENKYECDIDFINQNVTKKCYSLLNLQNELDNFTSLRNNFLMNRQIFIRESLNNYNGNASNKIINYIHSDIKQGENYYEDN